MKNYRILTYWTILIGHISEVKCTRSVSCDYVDPYGIRNRNFERCFENRHSTIWRIYHKAAANTLKIIAHVLWVKCIRRWGINLIVGLMRIWRPLWNSEQKYRKILWKSTFNDMKNLSSSRGEYSENTILSSDISVMRWYQIYYLLFHDIIWSGL